MALSNFLTKSINAMGSMLTLIWGASYKPIVPASAVTSVGVSLTTLFFCMEMFSQVAQFRMERIEDAIRIAMRFIVAKIVIENSSGIAEGIYGIFRIATAGGISAACDSIASSLTNTLIDKSAGGLLGIGFLLLFLAFAAWVGIFLFMFLKMAITFVGIAFEIGIHQAVAPIALSTLCNDLARPTGIAFIKSYAATCLQLVVISAIFSVFGEVMNTLSTIKLEQYAQYTTVDVTTGSTVTYTLGIFSFCIQFISPLICTIALSKAVKIASDLTKRMFGA